LSPALIGKTAADSTFTFPTQSRSQREKPNIVEQSLGNPVAARLQRAMFNSDDGSGFLEDRILPHPPI